MRPSIVDFLNRHTGTRVWEWLVPGYAPLLLLAFVAGVWITNGRVRLEKEGRIKLLYFELWIIVGCIVGARALYVITRWAFFCSHPTEILEIWKGGLVLYGGLLGGSLVAALCFRLAGEPAGRFSDSATPALALGLFIVRVGCFLNGCDYGVPCRYLWCMKFPAPSAAYVAHLTKGWIGLMERSSLPVHPTELYESVFGLFLFSLIHRRRPRDDGLLFLSCTMCYAAWRFFIEFIRGDDIRGFWGPLSTSQWISLFIFPIALVLFLTREPNRGSTAATRESLLPR